MTLTEMNKVFSSVVLFNLFNNFLKLHSSRLYTGMLETIFERSEIVKLCWLFVLKCIQRFLSVGTRIIWRSLD